MTWFFPALRALLHAPRFSVPVLLSLSLGLFGLTMIACVLGGVVFRALPFAQPEQLVELKERLENGRQISVAQQNARDLRAADTGLESLAVLSFSDGLVVSGPKSFLASVGVVGQDFLRTLRVTPLLGRDFGALENAQEDAQIALISERFWATHFNRDANVLNQTITAMNHSVRIVGVIAQAQVYPANAEVFLPESLGGFNTSRTGHNFAVLARLKTGVSLAQAQIKLDALATHWKAQYQKSTDAVGFPIRDLRASILGEHVTALYVAAAAAVFLLLIATLNASNLWLVRMLNLAQQNHTKMSLGASSSQLVREVLVQSFALSIIAWGLSLLLTKLGLVWLQGALQVLLPRGENIALDLPLATLLLAVSLGVGLICIVLPVLTVHRLAKASEFTRSARGGSESLLSSRTRLMLTSLQTAITVVLLCGCLFLYKSISTLLSVDPGYRIDGLVGATVSIPWQNSEQALAQMQRYVAAMEQIQALPGVKKVALSSGVPLSGMGSNGTFLIETPATEPLAPGDFASLQKRYEEASPEQSGQAQFRVVSKDYFDVFGIPVRFGRSFSAGDTSAQQHVAVISQSLADSVFPGRSPIGQRIQFGGMDGDLQPLQIVGVVGNVKLSALDAPDDQTVYVHLLQRPTHARDASLIAQSDLDPASVEKMMGQILNGAANLPANFSSMRQIRDKSLGIRQPLLLCFVYFVALAIALAALGSFGLTRYNLAQKRLELFLRHALGASQATLLWQQLRSALHPQVLAIGAGLLTAFVLSRALRSKLFDLGAQDPMSLASSGVIMLLVCAVSILLACAFSTRGAQARNSAG